MSLFSVSRGTRPSAQYVLLSKLAAFSTSSPQIGKISTVGIVGMGLMGHGIAQIASERFKVIACDTNATALDKGFKAIKSSLEKLQLKNLTKSTPSTAEIEAKAVQQAALQLANISTTSNVKDLASCDLIIEAIIENLDIKRKFYADLGKMAKKDAILASNTSSFAISELANASGCGERVVGLHFFNPVQLMKLVEVVRTKNVDAKVFERAMNFVKEINRVPVECSDTPGFIVNRLLVPYLTQAIELLDRGDAKKEDIDTAMKLGAGHPMGPIQLADYVGWDTTLAIVEGWKKKYPENPDFKVPNSLKKLVAEKKFGRKTGEGYYKWDGNKLA